MGSTGSGNGGNGGAGFGGDNILIVRGSRVTADDITMVVGGAGGTGGAGAIGGNGGNGTGGGLGFAITDRFQIPANRGLLQAGNVLGISTGIGGAGAVGGLSYYSTGNNVELRNADATVTSFVINVGGDLPDPLLQLEDSVRISDGTFNAGNSFTYLTPNSLSVLIGNASLNASAVGLSAGTFVADTVLPTPGNIGTITANAISLQSVGSIVVTANFATPGGLTAVGNGAINLGNINAGGVIGIQGTSLQLGNLTSGNHINLTSTSGAINAGVVSAANFIAMTAANGLTLTTATSSTGYIDLLVNSGNLTIGNLAAGTYIVLDTRAGNMALGNIQSGAETEIEAVGSVQFGNAVTGLEFAIEATGSITGGNVNAAGAVPTTSYSVGLLSRTGSIQVGNLTGARNIGLVAPGTITAGSLTSGENIIALGNGNILFNGPVTGGTGAANYFYVGNTSMVSLLGADFNPAPLFGVTPVRTTGSLTINGPIQTGNLLAGVGTAFSTTGAITATGGRVAITANSITAQAINSTQGTVLNATNGNMTVGNVASGGRVTLSADGGIVNAGTVSGTGVNVSALGAINVGGIMAGAAEAGLRSSTGTVTSSGAITGTFVSVDGIGAQLADITATNGPISILGGTGNVSHGTLVSSTELRISTAGSVSGGNLDAGTFIEVNVGGNIALGNVRSRGSAATPTSLPVTSLIAGGSITTGSISTSSLVVVRAGENISTGAITSANEIRLRGGSISTGALNAMTAVLAAATTGTLNTGNVTAGTSALLLAAQSVNTGAITTAATGTTFIGNSSVIPSTGALSTINLTDVLATTPVRVGGSVSISGPVTTGTLLSASTGSFSASSSITAGTRISLDVGGTAVFGGLAVAPTIAISSGDIAFSQNGGLGNASTGTITLTANRSGAVIIGGSGDSQSQQGGYTLDGSEISRIRAQNIVINAPNVSSTGTGVEIRALTMNGSAAASGVNLNGSEGSLTINTAGTIRVNGNAIFNSMASTNRVALNAARVEINADTGGIFLNGSSPGGVLSITANNIHIASASLLDQLASNVNFTGRDTALSLPIATSRPDGVIQASRLQFNVGSTLLIQNTGTSLLNAGFFGRVGSVEIVPRSSQSSSGLIDMVIYGQLLDTGDIVRNGSSVRDLIFPRSSSAGQDGPSTITGFTANSSVNGCLLSAISCGGGGISEQGPTVVVHAGPPPPRPAEERQAEREQEEAKAAAEEAARGDAAPRRPIMPPVTIVNTRRLGVDPIIDEPVTSGGNPNLQLDQPLPNALPDTGGQP